MIRVEVSSDSPGEGKSTVVGIITAHLERLGYAVTVAPQSQGFFTALDLKVVAEARYWAREPEPARDSRPKARVLLIVQG